MKLIDLLVKELPKLGGWPDGAEIAVQDSDSQICFSSHSDVYANEGKTDWYGGDWGNGCWDNPFIDTIADDRHECIVSRKQYESALAASDDWIEWHGGKCPVDSDAIVEVRYRKTNPYQYNNDRAGDFYWAHTGSCGDIIAYRVHDKGINSRANDDLLEQDLNECIGQDVDVQEWNGEGLPPVGCECELKYKCHNDDAYWERVIILWKRGDDTLVEYVGDHFKNTTQLIHKTSMHVDFRPLRAESERRREVAAKEMARHANSDQHRKFNAGLRNCLSIYDAIAAGKIPGVKLEGK